MSGLSMPSDGGGGPSRALRTLVVLVAVSAILVTLWYREGSTGPVHLFRSGAQTLVSPLRSVSAQIMQPLFSLAEALRDAMADDETLSELEAANAELTQRLAQMTELEEQNERLQQLLDITSSYGLSGFAAHVVGYSTDSWTDTATIDRGSLDGVEVDMPVLSGTGVLGQVVEVAASSATVRLLSDPSCGVSAEVQGSGASGVVTGSVDGTLRLRYVDVDAQVSVGDQVITSGLGGVYPRGLLLGTVASCTSSASGLYYDITLTPGVTTGGYMEVYVISSYGDVTDSTDVSAGDSSAADEASDEVSGDGAGEGA